jgi:hypothetical protein
VDKTRDFLVRHPGLAALAFAALVGACGFNAFRAGMTYADLRASVGEQARAASEALGG